MKKNLSFIPMLSIFVALTTGGLIAFTTDQNPAVNYETLVVEKTVAELQAKNIQTQKLLGKTSPKLEALGTKLNAKIAQLEKSIKEKISAADFEKLKQKLKNLREEIDNELAKLKK